MKIIDYKIITHPKDDWIVSCVKNLMEIGWQPLGACFVYVSAGGIYYNQTMVKYEDFNDTPLRKICDKCGAEKGGYQVHSCAKGFVCSPSQDQADF